MKNLWMNLPPFSPDIFGFNSIISGTDGMAVIDDVRGCAANYYSNEETRKHPDVRCFVSEPGNEDTITGTERVIRRCFEKRFESLNPSFAVLCSSPVSALIGTDFSSLARSLEKEYQIPVLHAELSGYETYEHGISATLSLLAKRFAAPAPVIPRSVNILGGTLLDWTENDLQNFQDVLASYGIQVLSFPGYRCTMRELQNMGAAEKNIAVTPAGLRAAEYLRTAFHTPFISGSPFGTEGLSRILSFCLSIEEPPCSNEQKSYIGTVRIIGEFYTACAIRDTINTMLPGVTAEAGSFFMMDPDKMKAGERFLAGEDDLTQWMQEDPPSLLIGDPLFAEFCPKECAFLPLPAVPVSSRMYADERPELLGEHLNDRIRTFSDRKEKP